MRQPVQLFKILSDETRLAIVMLLRESGEMCVCEICAATAVSQPKISRHIAILREAGLVLDRREGKWIHYRLSPHMPAWAAETIAISWQCLRDDVRDGLAKSARTSC
ncbi:MULTISPECIES: metalloregulator ArsR/SmtB family transcription factor [Citrobacter]|uniref:metalloregulator ArsR/SmtB family transcription factor n=1 Tax=Citrobacter TaxID=544 RepID=UPI0005A6A3D9|nr:MULTISPECIES: metalloregulator ArsR/SmtB family transcription factor [Citrobacter]EHG7581394.1 metalloregulator ArsR/SmtB family transcription factor [Citrobacter sedlakii]EHG7613088.1 metalloregulator ArsR/SmtB family transcription factor [Citrobacter sedlakii]EIQ7156813.1 metalloregulator ArsR/SmtB family transcription factor [Citrobacter sedlakii]EKX8504812.1 metalloregulator ArsR/SmtB family transcription factor [Citrobacter sedlakii]KSY29476.1 arsenite transporter [Citrobacter sp. 5067